MSSYVSASLAVPVSVASGAALAVDPRSPLSVGLDGTFVATVQLQWSPHASGTVWFNLGSALTAPGLVRLPAGHARRLRADTTAFTSGTPLADVLHDTSLSSTVLERTFKEDTLAVPAVAATNGAAFDVEDGEQCNFTLSGTFAATVQLQVSLSAGGSDWHDWGQPLTATGTVRVPRGLAKRVRARTTAFTSGVPVGSLDHGFSTEMAEDGNPEVVTAGALSLLSRVSHISVTGTQANTLDDGFYPGQRKSLVVVVAATTPAGTLTPANLADGTSMTLDALFESCELEWTGSTWRILNLNGPVVS